MATPSSLGILGHQVTAVMPLTTSTARYMVLRLASCSDTGTLLTTSRTFDLSRGLHFSATGGKPLDITLHPRSVAAQRFKSLSVAVPVEIQFHDSGSRFLLTVAHKTRSATAGAGSTWETMKTNIYQWRAGTDTDTYYHTGAISSVNAQAIKRYYKANITFGFRKSSSTAAAAKDTTTAIGLVCNSPVLLLSGADFPQTAVPNIIS